MRVALTCWWPLVLVACASEPERRDDTPPDPPAGCAPGELSVEGVCVPAGIASCAEGFASDGLGGCSAVLPEIACGPGEMALPGDTACRPVGSCAAGRWGDIPLAGSVVFVDGASASGDGSEAAPYAEIGEAIAAAPAGAVVAIAAGSYAESLTLYKPLTLWGACASEVAIDGGGVATLLVSTGADGAVVRNLSITGSGFGIAVSGALDVSIEDVRVHDTGDRGIDVEDTLGSASASVRRSLIEQAADIGAFALSSELWIEDSEIRDTRAVGGSGRGISVQRGALTLVGSVISGCSDTGVRLAGATGEIRASVIRDTRELPNPGDLFAGGVTVGTTDDGIGSSAVLRDVIVERSANYGVLVEASQAGLDRVVVRDGQPLPGARDHGAGLHIQSATDGAPAHVTVDASVFERNRYAGINATGAELALTSTIVRDSLARFGGGYGRGVLVFHPPDGLGSTTASLVGCVIARNVEAGLSAHGVVVTVDQTAIFGGLGNALGDAGRGASIQSEMGVPSSLLMTASALSDNHDIGLYLQGSSGHIAGTTIDRTLPRAADGLFGDGLYVDGNSVEPADALVESSRIVDNARVGVASLGADIGLSTSSLGCNAIPLNGQNNAALGFSIRDLGGNDCGCTAEEACKIVSEELAPPTALPALTGG